MAISQAEKDKFKSVIVIVAAALTNGNFPNEEECVKSAERLADVIESRGHIDNIAEVF